MFNDWLTLVFLVACLFATIRPLWSETIRTAGAGYFRWPVRVRVQIRLPIPQVSRQQYFLSPQPPLEAVPTGSPWINVSTSQTSSSFARDRE